MDKLKKKYIQLVQALKTLEKSLSIFNHLQKTKSCYSYEIDYEEEYRIHRDSVIQRFEYTIDLFWKFIKKYLELTNISLGIKTPSEVIRQACVIELISEKEAELILKMIKNRNTTSHIYVEEIAEQLVFIISQHYTTLHKIIERIVIK
jgi:nucleotidyltransferase substrate binding protein (TIGR01987 family)